jgi:hypothetical protein
VLFTLIEPGKHDSAFYRHDNVAGKNIGREIAANLPRFLSGRYNLPYSFIPVTEHPVHQCCQISILVAHLQSGISEYSAAYKSNRLVFRNDFSEEIIQTFSRCLPRQGRVEESKEFRPGFFQCCLRNRFFVLKVKIEAALCHPRGGLQIVDTRRFDAPALNDADGLTQNSLSCDRSLSRHITSNLPIALLLYTAFSLQNRTFGIFSIAHTSATMSSMVSDFISKKQSTENSDLRNKG